MQQSTPGGFQHSSRSLVEACVQSVYSFYPVLCAVLGRLHLSLLLRVGAHKPGAGLGLSGAGLPDETALQLLQGQSDPSSTLTLACGCRREFCNLEIAQNLLPPLTMTLTMGGGIDLDLWVGNLLLQDCLKSPLDLDLRGEMVFCNFGGPFNPCPGICNSSHTDVTGHGRVTLCTLFRWLLLNMKPNQLHLLFTINKRELISA